MFVKDASRSFIATITTQVQGKPGWWDCRELKEDKGKIAYTVVPWLTVLDTPAAQPARFRFDYYRDPQTGTWGYDVLAWDLLHGRGFASLGVRFGLSHNHYVGLYPPEREVHSLWKLFSAQGRGLDSIVETGALEGVQLRSARKRMLCAYNHAQVGKHWFSYVADEGANPMALRLNVVHVGEELLDDH